ncbi:MAG TPA: hypothetical protein VHE30_20420 [Polyangiaceae bacterium]|nr:hypothetical protein [Polyangiaceae bacterium]
MGYDEKTGMRAFWSSLLFSFGVLAGCGGHEAPPLAASRVSLLDAPKPSPSDFPTPAVYRYHPREAAALGTRVTLPDGAVVLAGQRGERWLVAPEAAYAVPAAELAPEDLILAQKKDSSFLFLGRSGTTYESKDAIGPFVRSTTPLEPLVRVAASGSVLVGVRKDLTLARSDSGGAAWSKVGPDGVVFQDVALRPDGKGLALAVPEALFATSDFGASFVRTAIPPLGAIELLADENLGVVVSSALGYRVWDADHGDALGPLTRPLAPRTLALGTKVPLGPSASALAEGRAVVVDGRWLELRWAGDQGYDLTSGAFGQPLTRAPLPFLAGCSEVRLAGGRKALYAVCARQKAPLVTQPFEVRRSADGGRTWTLEPYAVEGRTSELALAVTDEGALVVSGVCPATLRGPGCRPMGVHVRGSVATDGGTTADLVPAATPSLATTPYALLASYDGRTLYALGRRSKGDALSVFVSHDHGASFDARDVESIKLPEDDSRPRGSDLSVEGASAAEDGTVSFVLSRSGRRTWLVLDDDGRALAVAKPPVENARLGAAGQRGFAVTPQGLDAWESLDGGATFTPLGKLPVDPCPGPGECSPRVACTAMGCVLSDVVTRLGWRATASPPVLPPPAARAPVRTEPRVSVPYVCSLESGEWRRIQGALGPPDAEQAAIGKLAWFVLRHEPIGALVSVTEARLGRDPVVDDVTLLPRVAKPADYAYTATIQIEGAAAMRYPVAAEPKAAATRKIEIAWQDALFGHIGHATIPDGTPLRPGDYEEKGAMRLARPALLSIARGGVYVRVHATPVDAQPAFFVDGKAVETVPEVKWADAGQGGFHAEIARLGRTHLPLRIEGATVVRASAAGSGWTFAATNVGLSDARVRALDPTEHTGIAYAGETAGLLIETAFRGRPEGLLYPFRAEGRVFDEPVHVPTQKDLPVAPRPCSAADKAGTPRIVSPFRDGSRHPVIVTDPIEPMRVLLTGDAVLHGTPESPCAAAFEASLVFMEAASLGQTEQGVVFPDANERSYLFRNAAGTRDGVSAVEYRSMTCRAEPTAEVPREVWSEKGTHIDVY